MFELLTNKIEVVDMDFVLNSSLRLRQWLLVGMEEVKVFSPSLRLRQWLLIRAEEVRISSPSLRLWQWLFVGVEEVRVSSSSLRLWQWLMVRAKEVVWPFGVAKIPSNWPLCFVVAEADSIFFSLSISTDWKLSKALLVFYLGPD